MPQSRLIVMRLPIGPRAPLRLGLAGGDVIGDFHRIKAHAPGHRILIGDHRADGAQFARIAAHPQAATNGKAAPVVEGRHMHANERQAREIQRARIIGMGKVCQAGFGEAGRG